MKKRTILAIFPPLGALLIRLLYATCKKRFFLPPSIPSDPSIIAFWHGELLMQPFLYKKVRGKHKIAVMISQHFDGEIIARVVSFFGIEAVRGSSTKGGAKALIGAMKLLRSGYDIAITPDGPRGPRRSVAMGIVALAKKTGSPILPFSFRASSYWKLKSWDGFVIPKPFSTIEFYVGEPFVLTALSDSEAQEFVQKRLLAINAKEEL